ncbi:MAG: amidohydrolase family protein [Rhodoglobus sp.]
MTTAQPVVDSHIHFWDTDRFDYPWLQGFTELNRPFVPADLDVGDVLIEGLIFVQANPVWEAVDEETAWVQDLRGRDPRIQGLVAGVPLDRGAAAVNASLQRLSHEPGVAGVRQLIQDENEGFALQPQFVDAVQLAGQFGLTVDLCVRNHQIAEVTKLAELCPEGIFVLNHLGKPDVAGGQWTGWLHDIKAMAHLDNVRCKLSGLTTEAGEGSRGTNNIRRYLRAAVDAFGPDRCMFGSDWPNAGLHISYAGWVSLVLDSVSDLGARERDRVMRGTALEVYARAWESR